MLRYVLLALLADGQARHGYALMKAFADRSGVTLSLGNVYRELQWLVAEGYIRAAANPAGADTRRVPYVITDLGRRTLDVWMGEKPATFMRQAPDTLSWRLALIGDVAPARATAFLDALHTELWAEAKMVERDRRLAARREQAGTCFPIRGILLTRKARELAADIELLDQIRERLATWHAAAPPAAVADDRPAADGPLPGTPRSQQGA